MASQNDIKTRKKSAFLYTMAGPGVPQRPPGGPRHPTFLSASLQKLILFKEPYTTVSWGVFCGGEDYEIWDLLGRALCEPKPHLGRPSPGR